MRFNFTRTQIAHKRPTDPECFPYFFCRSTRPSKRGTADPNDSASSGEEDDDDGFEILTAENLFSTLLSRVSANTVNPGAWQLQLTDPFPPSVSATQVRALTNRLNVNDVNSPRFPASRFMSNLRQTQAPFWHHQDPFGRYVLAC